MEWIQTQATVTVTSGLPWDPTVFRLTAFGLARLTAQLATDSFAIGVRQWDEAVW
jgi:hypothetical protein